VSAERRIAEVVGAVAKQALADRGLTRVALLDDGGPEAELAARLLATALDAGAVERVTVTPAEVESVLHLFGPVSRQRAAEELRRAKARTIDGALPAHPANKTALLLGGELPPEPLLPLGDLWASEVGELAGGWSAPDPILQWAKVMGGMEALDAVLRRWSEERDPHALDDLSLKIVHDVRGSLAAGRPSRIFPRIVPKLGFRTLGVDLFE
jgi:hypothetical protein